MTKYVYQLLQISDYVNLLQYIFKSLNKKTKLDKLSQLNENDVSIHIIVLSYRLQLQE